MPNPYIVTFADTGAKTPCVVDRSQSPFNLSVGVVVEATGEYGVEFTLDDLDNPEITPEWFPDANLPPGQTGSGVTNYMFPVQAIRINITANTGAIRFIVLQGTQQP